MDHIGKNTPAKFERENNANESSLSGKNRAVDGAGSSEITTELQNTSESLDALVYRDEVSVRNEDWIFADPVDILATGMANVEVYNMKNVPVEDSVTLPEILSAQHGSLLDRQNMLLYLKEEMKLGKTAVDFCYTESFEEATHTVYILHELDSLGKISPLPFEILVPIHGSAPVMASSARPS